MSSEFYEVRCENCNTSFAPGTKQCVHCGGPLGGGLAALLRQRGAAGGEPAPISEEDGEQFPQAPGRSLLWIITAALAVGLSMLRACMER